MADAVATDPAKIPDVPAEWLAEKYVCTLSYPRSNTVRDQRTDVFMVSLYEKMPHGGPSLQYEEILFDKGEIPDALRWLQQNAVMHRQDIDKDVAILPESWIEALIKRCEMYDWEHYPRVMQDIFLWHVEISRGDYSLKWAKARARDVVYDPMVKAARA